MSEQINKEVLQELLIRFSLETVFIALIFLTLYKKTELRDSLLYLSTKKSIALITLFIVMLTVQLVARWQYFIPPKVSFSPFARFAMYQTGSKKEFVTTYDFILISGKKRQRVNITKLFSAIGLPSLNTKFRVILKRLESKDPEMLTWAHSQVKKYAYAITKELKKKEIKVDALEFIQRRIDTKNGYQNLAIENKSLMTISTTHL